MRQEDRQRCDALLYYNEHAADLNAGELGTKQPLPPPLAALHDAIVTDATALRAKFDELRDFVEVQLYSDNYAEACMSPTAELYPCPLCTSLGMVQDKAFTQQVVHACRACSDTGRPEG